MAYTANTAFAAKVTNGVYNALQNVAGKFGSFADTTFTPADISAGFLAVQHSLIPAEGYAGLSPAILNGNTWYFIAASSGIVDGFPGDHTGIYAANTYDVNKLGSGDFQFNLGQQTLGLGIPAGQTGTFTELLVGEQYLFGAGDFASAPTVGQYVTVSGGPDDWRDLRQGSPQSPAERRRDLRRRRLHRADPALCGCIRR